jgi:hypothetical protein
VERGGGGVTAFEPINLSPNSGNVAPVPEFPACSRGDPVNPGDAAGKDVANYGDQVSMAGLLGAGAGGSGFMIGLLSGDEWLAASGGALVRASGVVMLVGGVISAYGDWISARATNDYSNLVRDVANDFAGRISVSGDIAQVLVTGALGRTPGTCAH